MTGKKSGPPGQRPIALNKQARRLYELLDSLEAGLVLTGSEVKSLRQGRVSFKDGYVSFREGEAWLVGVHIAPYENAGYAQHDPERPRKLLLRRGEISSLRARAEQKGLTVVPVKLYFSRGRVKLEIALGKGKKVHDRKDDLKERDIRRDTEREMDRHR
ncbi:MAG: SsrA-binding protein SmpB [Desulfovibrionaceae bacterium]|nr:SsrA-binding protein SmpB [Desulfovibrionaceae bacterium]